MNISTELIASLFRLEIERQEIHGEAEEAHGARLTALCFAKELHSIYGVDKAKFLADCGMEGWES